VLSLLEQINAAKQLGIISLVSRITSKAYFDSGFSREKPSWKPAAACQLVQPREGP